MWCFSSSVGRKFIMALTGACLVLFLTFHCVMNAICICWPVAYNQICEFLGANWYALIASAGLGALVIVHIIYAVWLTIQNRKARGNVRYLVEKRPKSVEWSSKNMLVLGIVILAFLVVHLIQFWAKMQLVEIRDAEGSLPPTAGTLFIQEAFSLVWTPIVYIIGFVALWFHMNHGFWSMFQSVGWDNTAWIKRWKTVGSWWVSIVIALFLAQAIVFTVKSHQNFYKEDPALRSQYVGMVAEELVPLFGPQMRTMEYEQLAESAPMALAQLSMQQKMMQDQYQSDLAAGRESQIDPAQLEKLSQGLAALERIVKLVDYLESVPEVPAPDQMMPTPPQGPQGLQGPQVTVEEVTEETDVETVN